MAKQPTPHSDEVDLCKGCGTMKHLNSDGLCGRCAPHSDSELLDKIIKTVKNNKRMILNTQVIGRDNTDWCNRDDLWAISTDELAQLVTLIKEADHRAEKLVVETRVFEIEQCLIVATTDKMTIKYMIGALKRRLTALRATKEEA